MYKIILLIFCCALFFGCKHKSEFTINGKSFYTNSRCIKSETEMVMDYIYGYNPLNGNWESHYEPTLKTICVKCVIDTIEIK